MLLPELAAYLTAAGIGISTSTNPPTLYYGFIPPEPDVMVALFEYGGLRNEPAMGLERDNLEYPMVQAVARGVTEDYDGPKLQLLKVVTALALIADQSLSGVNYSSVVAKQPVFFLRRDENFRVYHAVNFEIMKDYSPT